MNGDIICDTDGNVYIVSDGVKASKLDIAAQDDNTWSNVYESKLSGAYICLPTPRSAPPSIIDPITGTYNIQNTEQDGTTNGVKDFEDWIRFV